MKRKFDKYSTLVSANTTKSICQIEEELAMENYGVPYSELDEDIRGELSFDAWDIYHERRYGK